MSVKEFIKSFSNNKTEGEFGKTILLSLITSLAIFFISYFFSFKYTTGFISKFGFFILFSILSYALILPSIKYVRAYKEFSCMPGMMIGMTLGMIAGFLPGFYIGSTNGMFVGSVFGMSIGIFVGIWNGRCCGVMGVMEGVMAGFMGGLMGAMTAVMMLNDNLKVAGVVVFLIAGFILFGLNYMIYKETREMEIQNRDDEFFTVIFSLILTAFTLWIMVMGPMSLLFQ